MFQSRKRKLQTYLDGKTASGALSPFDELVSDYLSGKMKDTLLEFGAKKVEIHIDWLPDYQCIGIQGVHDRHHLDVQIEPAAFTIGYAPDEPDDHSAYPLQSREQVYAVIKQTLGIS